MTNHWSDLQHCKTILVEGSNVAENHPMAFKWIRKAQENGATIIHVDPRFSRTSAAADIYARIRPGADAAFLNTIINYVIVNELYDEDYVVTHTNALFLGDPRFAFRDGLFSGFLDDPIFQQIVARDLKDGCHFNPTNNPAYFTTAFFHHPDELRQEIADAGLDLIELLGMEGPCWLLQNFDDHWNDPARRQRLIEAADRLGSEPTMLGVSAHLLALARR